MTWITMWTSEDGRFRVVSNGIHFKGQAYQGFWNTVTVFCGSTKLARIEIQKGIESGDPRCVHTRDSRI